MSAQLLSICQGRTMILTLSHAEQENRLTSAMMAAGIEALNVAESNSEISAVVLVGLGANFCAGLAEGVHPLGGETEASVLALFHQWLDTMRTFPKPIVAALEGSVKDEGLLLALTCDWLIASKDCLFQASALASRNANLKAHAGLLARQLPKPLAFELLASTLAVSAQRLSEGGVIHRIGPTGQTEQMAIDLAERLSRNPLQEFAHIKEMFADLAANAS